MTVFVQHGETALHMACWHGHSLITQLLCQSEREVDRLARNLVSY